MTALAPAPPKAGSARVTVGVDLGGTGTRIVALDCDGTVRSESTFATPADVPAGRTPLAELIGHVRAVAGRSESEVLAVGIGASGPVDADGVIRNVETLPAFSDLPLVEELTDALDVPCVIDNDTVASAIGENTYGAGRQSPALLMITLGTGIGACLLTAGGPFRGGDGLHPEAGHLPVNGPPAPCYCGLSTCWEQLASRRALDLLTRGDTGELAAAAADGDRQALEVFQEYGRRVGSGTRALVTVLRPRRVVFGGSAARYLPLFAPGLDQGRARSQAFAYSPTYAQAQLGALSGAIGAAIMAREARCPTVDGR